MDRFGDSLSYEEDEYVWSRGCLRLYMFLRDGMYTHNFVYAYLYRWTDVVDVMFKW